MKTVHIIGAGFAGLSAACYLAKAGYKVHIYEKNQMIGGRARQLRIKGFTFDMGPTFYWMPDVFEKFFNDFGKTTEEYYKLIRLDPGYEVYYAPEESISIAADMDHIQATFEKYESGSGVFLQTFLKDAKFNYEVAMNKVVYQPGLSPLELVLPDTIKRINQFFSSLSGKIGNNIKDKRLKQILEFPVLFLGAKPTSIPAFYCFMNYADMVLGTWHIEGGIYELVKGIGRLAEELGVAIHTNSYVNEIKVNNGVVQGLLINGKLQPANIVISGADYHHTECLLKEKERNYTPSYWKKRVMAPSALLFYIAFNKKIKNVSHHTLFFDTDFEKHAEKIYDQPEWPESPLFYASFPTCSDLTMGPAGKETAVILIPVAAGLTDTPEIRERYFNEVINRMEKMTAQSLKDEILFYRSYGIKDFMVDYGAYKGNAYGLANILTQTAFLKPKMKNRKVKNLFYTGQLTVPGPGIPPALISGKIVSELLINSLEKEKI